MCGFVVRAAVVGDGFTVSLSTPTSFVLFSLSPLLLCLLVVATAAFRHLGLDAVVLVFFGGGEEMLKSVSEESPDALELSSSLRGWYSLSSPANNELTIVQ